ncbi:hypothetical protein REPUB_Repub11eG0140800 [Reevesia pubescens]
MVFVVSPKVYWRWLRRVFQRFVKVIDVFISRKRNKLGSKMGFVRFESVNEVRNAQRQLNRVRFLDYRIQCLKVWRRRTRAYWFHGLMILLGGQRKDKALIELYGLLAMVFPSKHGVQKHSRISQSDGGSS